MTGFHMEKAFTETEFQINDDVCVQEVNCKSLMEGQVCINLEFSRAAK